MPQKMNNEQIGVSSISSTTLSSATSTTAAGNSSAAAAQLIKAISTGAATANANGNGNATATGTGNAKDKDKDTNIATLVTKIQAIIPDTPIVSIAAGTLSESTSTTTSTKTTPTPYFQEQLTTLMSHNVKLEQRPANDSSNSNSNSYDLSNKNNNSSQSASVLTQNHVPAGDKKSTNTNTNSNNNNAAGSSTNSSIANAAHHNLNLTPLLSKSGQPAPEVIAAATALHQRRGATTKGKTQDDQNVGKRQKNKKTKYDAWEDSEINDLDDASLKKLLEEAYWYRNPGDRKNKSERFLQMLKKAEYDEANSYRAIKTCLTRNTSASSSTSSGYYGHSSSVGSGSNFGAHNSSSSYHTNHRTASQRHKQGGSLQDLVEATHRSELATTSSAAAAAAATQRFNCDYQLIGASSSSGGNSNTRANRRQQHNNSSNSNNQNSAVVGKKSLKNNNSNSSSVSVRQREGGSLPSSVNFEMANMDGKQKLAIGDEGVAGNANPNPNPNPNTVNASTSKGNRNNTGSSSSSSLPSQLNETGNTVIEFDVDGNGDRDAAAADVGGAIGGGAIGGGAIGGGAIGGGDGGGALTASQLFDEALEVRDGTVEMWDINLDQTLWDMINYSQAYSNAEDEHLLNDSSKLQAARNDKGMPNVAANQAMPLKCENQLDILKQQQQQQQQQQEQQQQQQQQPDGKDLGPVKEFLIDDPLHFSMLETSAKNQKLEQQQLPLPQYPPALASAVASGQFTLPLGEQKRKVDAGYVSLNDSYTACSSVFGLAGNFSSGSKSSSKGSGGGNSAELFGGADLRPAKIGRMMTAAAAAAVVASHGAKATTVSEQELALDSKFKEL